MADEYAPPGGIVTRQKGEMMRVEQLTPRELEYKDVKFTAKISKYDNCCCDGCFRLGRVTKIIMPETKHYNGGELKTTYSSYWFCESCMNKLKAAIENPPQEVK